MRYNILLTLAVALVAPTATKAAIGDQFTKDGVRYEIFQEYTENGTLKVVAPGIYIHGGRKVMITGSPF